MYAYPSAFVDDLAGDVSNGCARQPPPSATARGVLGSATVINFFITRTIHVPGNVQHPTA